MHSTIHDGGHVCVYLLSSTMYPMLVTEQYCGEGSALQVHLLVIPSTCIRGRDIVIALLVRVSVCVSPLNS